MIVSFYSFLYSGMVYKNSGSPCVLTCENYEEFSKNPERCPLDYTDGCFCPDNMVSICCFFSDEEVGQDCFF